MGERRENVGKPKLETKHGNTRNRQGTERKQAIIGASVIIISTLGQLSKLAESMKGNTTKENRSRKRNMTMEDMNEKQRNRAMIGYLSHHPHH